MKIKQTELQTLLIRRTRVSSLKFELKTREAELKDLETDLFSRVDAKAPFQRGAFLLLIKETPGQCRPKWKDEFAKRLGAHAVEEVLKNTVPATKRSLTLLENGEEV